MTLFHVAINAVVSLGANDTITSVESIACACAAAVFQHIAGGVSVATSVVCFTHVDTSAFVEPITLESVCTLALGLQACKQHCAHRVFCAWVFNLAHINHLASNAITLIARVAAAAHFASRDDLCNRTIVMCFVNSGA